MKRATVPPGFRVSYCWGYPDKASLGTAINAETPWEAFAARLAREPERSPETMAQYHAAPPEWQREAKARPWFTGGPTVNGRRHDSGILTRTMLTFDIDHCRPSFLAHLLSRGLFGLEIAGYTTRSSTPEAPRVRFAIPLAEPILSAWHRDVARGLGRAIVETFEVAEVDRASWDATRLMYGPSLCLDAPHCGFWHRGEFAPVARLAAYAPPEERPPLAEWKGGGSNSQADWVAVLRDLGAPIVDGAIYRGEPATNCLWHDDANPSLSISERGVGVCFGGCEKRGWPLSSYIMRAKGFPDTPEGRRELGLYFGRVLGPRR